MAHRYDTEMIRDFLDHLAWEVRISEFESSQAGMSQRTNPELTDQLKKYAQKYPGSLALLPVTDMKKGDCSQDEFLEAISIWKNAMRTARRDQLEHLEALAGLFKTALECAECQTDGGKVPIFTVNAADCLPGDESD